MAQLVIGIGLAYVASRIMRKRTEDPTFDETTPTMSERGDFAPLVLGTRRIGPVIAGIWGREAEVRVSGGGSKGGSNPGQKTNVYFERAWHILCVGPIYELHGLFVSDKEAFIAGAPLTRWEDNEGALTHVATVGASELSYLRCYYGTEDQAIDQTLFAHTGVGSRWPNIAYVVWDRRFLGQGTNWPQIDYVVTVRIDNPVLTQSQAWLNDGNTTGVNPAHALYQVLTAPYPWGCAIPKEHMDLDYFEILGQACETEHIPLNMVAADGGEAINFISDILNDHGIALPQIGDVISPVLLREWNDAIPTLTDDVLPAKPIEYDIANEETQIARMIYQFANAGNKWSAQDIVVEDDSVSDTRFVKKEKRVPLPTIIHYSLAAQTVNRKEQEALVGDQVIKFTASRKAINLSCGMVFQRSDGSQYRVISVQPDLDNETCMIEAIPDIYFSSGNSISGTDPQYPDGVQSESPAPDIFDLIGVTRALTSSVSALILRGRANDFTFGANGWLSLDDVSYTNFNETSSFCLAVGTVRAITQDGLPIITITRGDAGDVNDNAVQVPNITFLSQSVAWGFQHINRIAAYATWTGDTPDETIIDGDADGFAQIRSLEALDLYLRDGDVVTYDGEPAYVPRLTSALQDDEFQTKRNDPVLGEPCFIFLRDTSVLHEFEGFYARVNGTSGEPELSYAKSQPYTDLGALDLTTITPESKLMTGAALAPLPAQDFRTTLTDNQHNGTTCVFEWEAIDSDSYSSSVPVKDFIIEIRHVDTGEIILATQESSQTTGTKTKSITIADLGGQGEAFYADIWACDDKDNPLYRSFASRILVTEQGTYVLCNGRHNLILLLDDPSIP